MKIGFCVLKSDEDYMKRRLRDKGMWYQDEEAVLNKVQEIELNGENGVYSCFEFSSCFLQDILNVVQTLEHCTVFAIE